MASKKHNIIETLDFLRKQLLVEQHKYISTKKEIESLHILQAQRKTQIKSLNERIDYELNELTKVSQE